MSRDILVRMPLSPLDGNEDRSLKLRAVKSLDLQQFKTTVTPERTRSHPLRSTKSMAFHGAFDSEESFSGSDTDAGFSPPFSHVLSPPMEVHETRIPSKPHSGHKTHHRALSRVAHIGTVPPLEKSPNHTPLNSPKIDQMCIFTAQDAINMDAALDDEPVDSLQNILSVLAQKERRVLEAEDTLRSARADLEHFRDQINALMDPLQQPRLYLRPRIISRSYTPNLGINGLHLVPMAPAAARFEDTFPKDFIYESIAFRLVHSLLGFVHCIISVFPRSSRGECHEWSREYLTPSGLLYGMEY